MLNHIHKCIRAVSFIILFKGVVGGSLATLALFGYVVPAFFGWDPSPYQESVAAGLGALLGAIAAIKA